MSDEELQEYIDELTRRLADAQLTLDYTRILRSAAVFHQDLTRYSRANQARKRRETIEQRAVLKDGKLVAGGKKANISDPIKILMKSLSLTYEEAVLMSNLLNKVQKQP